MMMMWVILSVMLAGKAAEPPGAAAAERLAAELIEASSLKQLPDSYANLAKNAIERKRSSGACQASPECLSQLGELEARLIKDTGARTEEIRRRLRDTLAEKFTVKELEVLIKIQKHSVISRFNTFLNSDESFQPVQDELDRVKAQVQAIPAGTGD